MKRFYEEGQRIRIVYDKQNKKRSSRRLPTRRHCPRWGRASRHVDNHPASSGTESTQRGRLTVRGQLARARCACSLDQGPVPLGAAGAAAGGLAGPYGAGSPGGGGGLFSAWGSSNGDSPCGLSPERSAGDASCDSSGSSRSIGTSSCSSCNS